VLFADVVRSMDIAAALGPDRVKTLFVIGIPHPAALKPSLKKL
jgi:hypothetical protein